MCKTNNYKKGHISTLKIDPPPFLHLLEWNVSHLVILNFVK